MQPTESSASLTSSMEDYLEAIYHLEKDRRIARVRDIASRLGVKMSSVSSALKSLSSRGLISYDPHQYITLTQTGIERAEEIVRRHEILRRFLVRILQVDGEVAEENACRMEHHLDPEVTEKLVDFMEFIEMCPVDQRRWLEDLTNGCDDCVSCLEDAKKKIRERVKAQQLALAEGMTLAESEPEMQIVIVSLKGTSKFKSEMSEKGLSPDSIAEVEENDADANIVQLNVKGYHVTVTHSQAERIRVKPV